MSVEYAWRIACGIWYDYSIERVGGMPYSCVQSLGGVDQLLRKVSELLIIANPAGFPPLNKGECETNWRVLKGSCWRPDIALGVPVMPGSVADPDIFYPCSPTDCCLEHYTVCIDQNGDRIITNTGYLPPEDPECLEDAPYHDEFYRCHPVCGSIYNR